MPYGRLERLTIFDGLTRTGLMACWSLAGAADAAAHGAFTAQVAGRTLAPAKWSG